MSGGVDSAVAAYLLLREGFDVTGFTLKLFDDIAAPEDIAARGCCSLASIEDARRVARILGIPHYVLNYKDIFERTVIGPFCDAYRRGRTPNPCIACNQWVKFHHLLDQAARLGMDFLATGHYAIRKQDPETGEWELWRGADPRKDQSYFLYILTQPLLARIMFPNGAHRKDEIRAFARAAGLPVAEKAESQEICFAPDGDYGRQIVARCPDAAREGPIRDREGNQLGRHEGIIHFTIGQRRGLGVSAPEPLYVLALDPETNTVIVGKNEELFAEGLDACDASFVGAPPADGETVEAQIRYNAPAVPAAFHPAGPGRFRLRFHAPQRAVAPGQAAVLYRAGRLLGGGTIVKPRAIDAS